MTSQEAQQAIARMKRGPHAREYNQEIERLIKEHGFLTPQFLHHFSQWYHHQIASVTTERLKTGAPDRSQEDGVRDLARYIRNCLDDE